MNQSRPAVRALRRAVVPAMTFLLVASLMPAAAAPGGPPAAGPQGARISRPDWALTA